MLIISWMHSTWNCSYDIKIPLFVMFVPHWLCGKFLGSICHDPYGNRVEELLKALMILVLI